MSAIPMLQGDSLYELFREELKGEVRGAPIESAYMIVHPEWAALDPHLQIAWGRLGRRLISEIMFQVRTEILSQTYCSRDAGHNGPCNGLPTASCRKRSV